MHSRWGITSSWIGAKYYLGVVLLLFIIFPPTDESVAHRHLFTLLWDSCCIVYPDRFLIALAEFQLQTDLVIQ